MVFHVVSETSWFYIFVLFLVYVTLDQLTPHRDFPEPGPVEPNGISHYHLTFCCTWYIILYTREQHHFLLYLETRYILHS